MTKAKEAQDWITHKHRGKTVYEGHPLDTISKALRLLRMVEDGAVLLCQGHIDDSGNVAPVPTTLEELLNE